MPVEEADPQCHRCLRTDLRHHTIGHHKNRRRIDAHRESTANRRKRFCA